MRIRRGDIWYIDNCTATGSEQKGRRPAIIMSNDTGNIMSPVVNVIWLTSSKKKPMPTHCMVNGMTALCEQIDTIDKSRILNFMGFVNEQEMRDVEECTKAALGM